MALKLRKFQTRAFDGWSTEITKANHIDSMYPQNQQAVADFMIQLMARNFGNSLETVLSRYDTKFFDDDREFFWDVIGSARRNYALVEARTYAGDVVNKDSGMIGQNREPFYLVFDEHAFFDGEEIMGELNEVYPIRIVDKPKSEGTRFVYLCEMANASNDGMPAERLLPGERFSYTFAPVERGLSKEVGGVRYATPMRMRNEFTTIRIHDEVSGDVYDKKIAIGVPMVRTDDSGKMVRDTANMWMHYWEWEFEKTWREYKNNLYAFSVSNRNENGKYMNYGKSGEVIRKGDGLYAQMKRGNVIYYSHFSLDLLENAMLSISTAKLENNSNSRHFLLRTGEYGARAFSKAVRNELSGWTEFTFNGDAVGAVKKTPSSLHENALSAGYQFTRFSGPNNMVLEVEVDSFYDDPVTNKLPHPDGGLASSWRFDIFDLGDDTDQNIFKCGIKNQPTEARSIQWGMRDPYTGRWGNEHMSFSDDKAVIHKMGQFGVCVKDPSRTVSFIPAILAS